MRTSPLTFVLTTLILGISSLAYGAGQATPSLLPLNIAQEISHQNGVWVSRPNPIDLIVRNFLLTHRINSLESYLTWLAQNMQYRKDIGPDTWSPPEETLLKQFGDCEDFAFLNAAVLKVFGFEPRVIALETEGNAHAVCIFLKDGVFQWLDNGKIKYSTAKSLNELAREFIARFKSKYLAELDLDSHRWNFLYREAS